MVSQAEINFRCLLARTEATQVVCVVDPAGKDIILDRAATPFEPGLQTSCSGSEIGGPPFRAMKDEDCSDEPSRSSRTEGEPWENIAKHLSRLT